MNHGEIAGRRKTFAEKVAMGHPDIAYPLVRDVSFSSENESAAVRTYLPWFQKETQARRLAPSRCKGLCEQTALAFGAQPRRHQQQPRNLVRHVR